MGEDIAELRTVLGDISEIINSLGHQSFIFAREAQDWRKSEVLTSEENKRVISRVFAEVGRCDCLFAFVNSDEKSEGMLLEVGYARALGKKIILAINKNFNPNFLRFLRAIANSIIEFENLPDLKEKIKNEGF